MRRKQEMKLKGNKLQVQCAQILPLSSLRILLFSVFLHILFRSKLYQQARVRFLMPVICIPWFLFCSFLRLTKINLD